MARNVKTRAPKAGTRKEASPRAAKTTPPTVRMELKIRDVDARG